MKPAEMFLIPAMLRNEPDYLLRIQETGKLGEYGKPEFAFELGTIDGQSIWGDSVYGWGGSAAAMAGDILAFASHYADPTSGAEAEIPALRDWKWGADTWGLAAYDIKESSAEGDEFDIPGCLQPITTAEVLERRLSIQESTAGPKGGTNTHKE